MLSTEIDFTADHINISDLTERFDELETNLENLTEKDAGDFGGFAGFVAYCKQNPDLADEAEELNMIDGILSDLKGYGGDEQWRGDWYPQALIRWSYFTEYAKELLEDCGTIPRDLPWWVVLDWEATAQNLLVDYSAIEVHGATYYYR
jgi:hypothetical protein